MASVFWDFGAYKMWSSCRLDASLSITPVYLLDTRKRQTIPAGFTKYCVSNCSWPLQNRETGSAPPSLTQDFSALETKSDETVAIRHCNLVEDAYQRLTTALSLKTIPQAFHIT
jgi:hypothetical protein